MPITPDLKSVLDCGTSSTVEPLAPLIMPSKS
jgi:hypothetical protein